MLLQRLFRQTPFLPELRRWKILLSLLTSTALLRAEATTPALLFFDEFDGGIPGWEAVQPPGSYRDGPMRWQFDIVNEAFVEQSNIYSDQASGSSTATAVMLINDAVAQGQFTFRARLTAGDDDGFGLIFGYQNQTNFFRVTFARQSRTAFPWTGWSVDRKVDGATVNLFGAGTPGYTQTFVNRAGRPFDVTVAITGRSFLTLTVVDDPEGAAQEYRLVETQPLAASTAGRVGLMAWGMAGGNPRGFQITNLELNPMPLAGEWNALSEWTPVVPPNALGNSALIGANSGRPIWSLALGPDGPAGLIENSDTYGFATAIGTNSNIDFVAPSLVAGDVAWSDYVVSARIIPGDDDGHGILLRYQNETNFYRVGLASEATGTGRPPKGISIQKNVNGNWSEVYREETVQFDPLPGIAYTLVASIEGNSLEIRIVSDNDGNADFFHYGPFEISGETVDHGRTGVFSWGMSRVEFDFVRVTQGVPLDVMQFVGVELEEDSVLLSVANNTGWFFDVEATSDLTGEWTKIAAKQNVAQWKRPLPDSPVYWRLKQSSITNEPLPFVPGSWTLAVLPDTQLYTVSWPEIFEAQTQWIADHRDLFNIVYVLHLGDIVHNNNHLEWQRAQKAMSILDGVVPYAMAPGNHDYGDNGSANNRNTLFNDYFPLSKYEPWPTFGGVMEPGKLDNSYHLFSAGGVDWLVLALEWGPRNSAVDWANQIVTQYPDRRAIFVTHAYLYFDDTRYDWATKGSSQSWNPYAYGTAKHPDGTNDGEDLWQKLVKKHPNFVMTLNGHVLGDGLGRLSSVGDQGNVVHQMLVNFQMKAQGGEGWLRLMEFLPDGETVQVKDYSPWLNRYNLGPQNQFTLKLEPPLGTTE